MPAVEIGGWNAVLCAGGWEAEFFLEDIDAVGACHARECVEEDFEVGVVLEELGDQREIEDLFEHERVIGGGVYNLDLQVAVGLGADCGDVDVGDGGDFVGCEDFRGFEDLVCYGFWGGATVREVILYSKVVLGSCGCCLARDQLLMGKESAHLQHCD